MLCASVCLAAIHATTASAETIFWENSDNSRSNKPAADAGVDPLGQILQAGIGSSDTMLQTASDINLYSEAMQSVSLTDLPFTARFKLSKQAMKDKNWRKAEELLPTLENTDEKGWSIWATALMQSEKGQFSEAYTTLSYFSHRFESPFYDEAQRLSIAVALRLAEEAQSSNNYALASGWLNRIDTQSLGKETILHYNRLVKKQNTAFLGDEADKGYVRPLRVSILLPLSGPLKEAGDSMLKAAQMSLFDHAPKTLLLYPQDTKGTVEGTRAAMETALRDKTDIVLGPLLSTNVTEVSYPLEMSNVPVIAFSSDHKVADKNTFLLNYMPAKQAELMAQHMVNLGYTRIATLTPENTYGHEVLTAFNNALKARGLTPVIQSTFNPNSNDHTAALEKLVQLSKSKQVLNKQRAELQQEYNMLGDAMDDDRKAELSKLKSAKAQPLIEFDALFVPASGEIMPLMASQLAYYDIDSSHILIAGTAQWNTDKIRQNKAEYLSGSHFIAPSTQSSKSFETIYTQTYGKKPHPLSALAYDAVMVVGQLFEENPQKIHDLKEFLVREEGFSGASGAFKFNQTGVSEHLYDIMELTPYAFKQIEAAPSRIPPTYPQEVDPRDNRTGFKFW